MFESTDKGFALFTAIVFLTSGMFIYSNGPNNGPDDGSNGGPNTIAGWQEPVWMPRDPECIDDSNYTPPTTLSDYTHPEYAIGYEPSLAADSEGNMFITAHKDLRWGGEDAPIPIFLDPDDPGLWYACEDGETTSWDYWASWFWMSNDGGETWGPGANFEPTPGNMLLSCPTNPLACLDSGSECLGDEGDISVDANDKIYYLDTTLEDNWWHKFTDGGQTYDTGACQRMNSMAADDRPWVAAQGDGIIHYLGNSGVSPPECSGDSGRYWYYHSEDEGNTFSQCYSMPGGWSTIAAERNGPHVYVAQEDQDSSTGYVHLRISDDYGRGTSFLPGDGSWQEPIILGERKGNPPEGYPVVNTNDNGTVAVVWGDAPDGGTGAWDLNFAISYEYGASDSWSTWEITPPWDGITMYPFVSISENNRVAVSFYGLDLGVGESAGYKEGKSWYLYSGYLDNPQLGEEWQFEIADSFPLHTITAYEETEGDVHALHDFFETVIAPDGSWMGIAYQRNIGQHPFEENEEQRYIMFVKADLPPV